LILARFGGGDGGGGGEHTYLLLSLLSLNGWPAINAIVHGSGVDAVESGRAHPVRIDHSTVECLPGLF